MSIHQAFQDTGKLALWCFIITIVCQLILFNMTIVPSLPFWEDQSYISGRNVLIIGLIGRLWMITGIILVLKALIRKESKNLSFKVAAIGFTLLLILELLLAFFMVSQ